LGYLKVYDRFETAFTGNGIAVLENASEVKIKEVINGEYTLSFVLPRNDPKWQYLQPENFVKVYHASQKKDQIFRIRKLDEIRDEQGKLTSNIQCEHVYYDAADSNHFPKVELIGKTPTQVLVYAFAGTRFTIGTVEVTTLTDIYLSKANPQQIVSKLIENVGGELIKDNWTINLVAKRGSDKGVQFRIGKNIKSLKRNTDATGIITRLYPYGKDSMEITTLNAGKAYIDSPLINQYDRLKIGYKDYKDIEIIEDLLVAAQNEWSTPEKDGIDKPRVTYNVEVVELWKLKEFGEIETFALGDKIRIIDDGIDADTKQRIIEYTEYPYEPKRSYVGLGNYETSLYTKYTTAGLLVDFMRTGRTVSNVTTGIGELDPAWFENIKEKLQTFFDSKLQKAILHKYGDIWVDNPDNPTKAMGIIADGFAIANSKDENGDWEWKTFGTADGFTADLINGGTIIGVIFKTAKNGTRIEITGGGIKSYNSLNQLHGMVFDPAASDADFRLYYDGDEYFKVKHYGDGIALLAYGNYILRSVTARNEILPIGNWDCGFASFKDLYDGNSWYATQKWVEDNFQPL
jgi:phage minor structural protein